MTYRDLDRFTRQYIETALWSTTDESEPNGGEPLDKNFDYRDIDDKTLARMVEDCRKFNDYCREHLDECGLDHEKQGHYFWLTRNGHGTGFWDQCFDTEAPEYEPLQRLSTASKACGEFYLYVGDDGIIYGS